jgi:hypothetical protein
MEKARLLINYPMAKFSEIEFVKDIRNKHE